MVYEIATLAAFDANAVCAEATVTDYNDDTAQPRRASAAALLSSIAQQHCSVVLLSAMSNTRAAQEALHKAHTGQ